MIVSVRSRLKVGVLASGRGSTLQALLDACAAPDFPAEIVHVVSNVANACALKRAAKCGIPTSTLPHGDFSTREDFDAALDAVLCKAGVEFACLAGFMRILSENFVSRWEGRLLNIHPALLPAFKGLHTHRRALEAGVKIHGCTVHFVRPALDDGPIVAQAAVPVFDDDVPDVLAARVLKQEHRLYPLALMLVASGRVRLEGNRVISAEDGNGERRDLFLSVPAKSPLL